MKFLSKKILLILALVMFLPISADASIISGIDFLGLVVSPFAYFLLTLTSLITMLSGVLLNGAIQFTIVDMSINLKAIGGINQAWSVIRDVANMGFIFVLLYASIMTIIGKEENAREIVVNIIIAAVLINFSLFFTKVAIDIFNMLAIVFYKATVAVPPAGALDFTSTGLSNAIMGALGVTSIFGAAGTFENASSVSTIAILSSVVLLITSFVFLAMSLMLIIRFVALIFVLILSPIAFLSGVLPGLSGVSKQWKDTLVGQGVFAPIFFLMMYVTIVLTNSIRTTTFGSSGGSLASIFGGGQTGLFEASGVPTLINFIIIIIFLVASLLIAKKYSDMAPSGVSKVTKWATGLAGGATLGVAGRFGRGTVGRFGQVVADSETLKKAAPTSRLARLALATGQKTAGSSFDVRGTALGGELAAGKAQSGGFAKEMKDRREAEKKTAESFKPSDLVISKAEKELDEAKKNGTKEEIAGAQTRVDDLKGVNEEEARKRKARELMEASNYEISEKDAIKQVKAMEIARLKEIKKLRDADNNLTQSQAEEKFDKNFENEIEGEVRNLMLTGMKERDARLEAQKRIGIKLNTKDSAASDRQKTYAKELEKSNIEVPNIPGLNVLNKKIGPSGISMDRIAFVGPVKKEVRFSAIDIRKKLKEKKPEEKLAEELSKAKESGGGDSDKKEDKKPTEGGGDAGAEKTKPSSE